MALSPADRQRLAGTALVVAALIGLIVAIRTDRRGATTATPSASAPPGAAFTPLPSGSGVRLHVPADGPPRRNLPRVPHGLWAEGDEPDGGAPPDAGPVFADLPDGGCPEGSEPLAYDETSHGCGRRVDGDIPLPHGRWWRRLPDGASEQGNMVNGRKQGPWEIRNPDGSLRVREAYAADQREGDQELYGQGEELNVRYRWKRGALDGTTEVLQGGVVVKTYEYRNGQEVDAGAPAAGTDPPDPG